MTDIGIEYRFADNLELRAFGERLLPLLREAFTELRTQADGESIYGYALGLHESGNWISLHLGTEEGLKRVAKDYGGDPGRAATTLRWAYWDWPHMLPASDNVDLNALDGEITVWLDRNRPDWDGTGEPDTSYFEALADMYISVLRQLDSEGFFCPPDVREYIAVQFTVGPMGEAEEAVYLKALNPPDVFGRVLAEIQAGYVS